jgi:hypothetical protein
MKTTSSSSSVQFFFGDPTAILNQSAKFEQRLKDRMALVVHNIENILHCFKDVDVKKTKSVSERAAGLQRFCPQPTPVLF